MGLQLEQWSVLYSEISGRGRSSEPSLLAESIGGAVVQARLVPRVERGTLTPGSLVASFLLCLCASASISAQTPADSVLQDPDRLVRNIYDLVTFEAGTTPNWDAVRSMFIEDAVIVLRTSRDSTSVFSVDGFIADFVAFAERPDVRSSGFREEVVRTKPMEFGDMAHVLVLYEASIPGSERPPQQGVDSFQLIKKAGRWWIVSITNEIPTIDRPVPPALQE